MFSMLPTPVHTHTQSHHYTPVHPSPLSSSPLRSSPTPSPLSQRDSNVPTSSPTRTPFCFSNHQGPNLIMSPTPTPKSRAPAHLPSPAPTPTSATPREGRRERDIAGESGKEIPFSRRPTKSNPLMHRDPQDGRETRRKLFLKRVRDNSNEKRYGGEEEMMRRIWVAEERRWEEERRREAIGMGVGVEDVDEDIENADDILVEEVARDEAEWEAFLGSMEEQSEQQQPQQQADTPYGSDDEEYDHIFMDVILEESRTASQQQVEQEQQPQQQESHADIDMMDMS